MTTETVPTAPPPKSMMRGVIVVVVSVAVGFLSGFALAWRPEPAAATVNGEVITMAAFHQDLESRFGGQVLRDMVSQRLIAQKARAGKIEVKPEAIEKRLKEMQQDPQVVSMISSGRISEEDLRRNLSTLMTLDALVLAEVTPEQEKAYFESHKTELQTIHLRHIQVATEEEARDLKAQLDKGADFAALARENSLDPATKDKGGDMGELRGDQLEPGVAAAVSKLAPGKVSDVVTAGLGYHLFQLVARQGEFASLRPAVREALAAPRRGDFVEALRGQAKIESTLPYSASSKATGEEVAP